MLKRAGLIAFILVLLAAAIPALAQDAPTVGIGTSEALGSYLVGPNGMTLYMFTKDSLDTSVCAGQCLENWPALTVEAANSELTAAEGVPGTLGTITRDDGTFQVTYNGMPLYYWAHDAAVGDTTGNRVGNVWWIVPPATIAWGKAGDLGSVLTGPTGWTLYIFTNDTPDSGASACAGGCLAAWPPLLVEDDEAPIVVGVNVPGEVGTITRDDGTYQVTYNGWPLYYFASDTAVGDATGEGVGGKWFTVGEQTVSVANSEELGDMLVASNGITLYAFANDTAGAGTSACSGGCAEAWPPYTVAEGTRLTAGGGVTGELATITREDGALQVTYNGWPLYFWKDDKLPGDATGNGVGGVWAVVAP